MSDTIAYIISGASILGGGGAAFFFKNKYAQVLEDFERKSKENSSSNDKLDSLQQELNTAKQQVEQAENLMTRYQNQAKDAQERFYNLQENVKNAETQVSEYQRQVQEAQRQLNVAQQEVQESNLLVAKYQKQVQEIQEQLLNSEKQTQHEQEQVSIYQKQIHDLQEQLNSAIKEAQEAANNSTPINNSQRTILLVDDSLVVRTKMSKVLIEAGYEVTTANDGAEALTALSNKAFDLVITDLEMPNVNGTELLAKISENPDWKNTPVVTMTGHDKLHFDMDKSASLSGVFKKPTNNDELLLKVRRLTAF